MSLINTIMKVPITILFLFASSLQAQTAPGLSSWILNTTGATGYGGLPSNIQRVQYSDSNVYISCSCIPGYDIGPWQGNPNIPKNENFVFRITRTPTQNTGTKTPTPLGHVGVWSNGVSIFNAKDARSYNNAGVWNQNAVIVEGASFDECLGHPAPNGEYHHHLNPICLYDAKDSTHHSPIIGYAFDGFPIYGAYGFAKTDGTGSVRRMRSSYRIRSITDRSTLPNGSTASQAGPPISTTYPLGYYLEDFEFVDGLGDLDGNNGRYCVTPDYPQGTYAYFVTIDSTGSAAFPYTVGPNYYGVVTAGDTGPGSGHVTISEAVLSYIPGAGGITQQPDSSLLSVYPNPATRYVSIDYTSTRDHIASIELRDERGVSMIEKPVVGPTIGLDLSELPRGAYFVQVSISTGAIYLRRMVKE